MQQIARYNKLLLALIPIISLAMHYRVMQLDLIGIHVWRQTETQTVINNFANDDFNILHPKVNNGPDTDRILRLEFPLMQWIFAVFFKMFGNHIIISRILSFIIGIFSVFGMYALLKNIFNNTALAVIGAWAFNFSPEFYYYTVNPLPDNMALCCAIWSAAFFFSWMGERGKGDLVFSFIFLSIASLVKLPFILYGCLPVTYVLLDFSKSRRLSHTGIIILILLIAAVIPPAVWYAMVIPAWHGNGIIVGIAGSKLDIYQILYILQGNLVSTLPELLINYGAVLFFAAGFWFIMKNEVYRQARFAFFALWGLSVLAYFFFELDIIANVHDYYLFPFLPLIFVLVAYGAYNLGVSSSIFVRCIVILLLLLLPVTAYLRTLSRWDTTSPGLNADIYNNKDALRKLTGVDDYCVVGNDPSEAIFLYYIDRKGWTFYNDRLTANQLKEWTGKGAKYLFTDSRVDTISAIKEQLGDKVFERNKLRVYKLKKVSPQN